MAFLLRILTRSSALRAVGSGVTWGVAGGVGSATGPAAEDSGGDMVVTVVQVSFKGHFRVVKNMPVPAISAAALGTSKWWG
jgi:hypothetical protein